MLKASVQKSCYHGSVTMKFQYVLDRELDVLDRELQNSTALPLFSKDLSCTCLQQI